MPIRRERQSLYPPNWKELSHRVRFERARGRCEACGRPHAHLIRCLPDGRWFDPVQQTWRDGHGRRARWPDLLAMIPGRTTQIVLAAAHLDHDPTNNRLRNLKSLCQRCHMLHDAPYHRAQRWITHRRRYAAADLFLGFYRLPDAERTAAADPPEKAPRLASPIEVMHLLAVRRPRGGGQAPGMAIAATMRPGPIRAGAALETSRPAGIGNNRLAVMRNDGLLEISGNRLRAAELFRAGGGRT